MAAGAVGASAILTEELGAPEGAEPALGCLLELLGLLSNDAVLIGLPPTAAVFGVGFG